MNIGLLFWVIMLLLLIGGSCNSWPANSPAGNPPGRWAYWPFSVNLILWVLLALLGWQAFGAMLHR